MLNAQAQGWCEIGNGAREPGNRQKNPGPECAGVRLELVRRSDFLLDGRTLGIRNLLDESELLGRDSA